jgi:drug/metabolite transporter (DMT)-like permease
MQRSTGICLLLLAALCWSSGGLLIKWVDWSPMGISGMRGAIAALFLLLIFRPKKWQMNRYMIGGALAYALCITSFVLATKWTNAANAILLQYTAPVHVAFFAYWFLGEKPCNIDWIAIAMVLAGMVLFFSEDLSLSGLWGNVAGLISGVGFAWIALLLRKQKDADPVQSVILGNLLAAVVGMPFMFGKAPTAMGWIGLVLLGLVQIGLGYALFSIAIRYVTAIEALLISTLEPILNPVWVFLLLGERPGDLAIIGGCTIIAAILLRSLGPWLGRNEMRKKGS